jgi:microcin C transport system substrate-binding protein
LEKDQTMKGGNTSRATGRLPAGPEAGHPFSRRAALALGAGAVATAMMPPAFGQAEAERHGISAFGDLKYPADFKHFDYANPDAPKGGLFSQIGPNRQYNQNFLTFNSLNGYIHKGDAAQGLELTFATLMAGAGDEPDSLYGLAARAVVISPDGLTYRFLLRPQATFHDGSRLTANDVAFSLGILKETGHPIIQQLMRDVVGLEAADDTTVVVRFAPNRGRDVPLFVAQLPIFSRAYYTARPFAETTLDPPLGSGGYKIGRFEAGRYIEYERVKDWWGAGLPVSRGLNNFDIMRFEFFRDRDASLQGFATRNYLFREEITSRIWATGYDFPAMRDGRVKREIVPDDSPLGAQGWFINTRREKFADPRVREALIYAFDFEWTNKNLMFGNYRRTASLFQNTDMEAAGPPSARELALLEPFRGRVSEEVFGEPFVPPVSDGSGADRVLLRTAARLLQEASFPRNNEGKRLTPKGEPLTVEFLIDDSSFVTHHGQFIKNLGTLGIDAAVRVVDPVQYRARLDRFDFDITVEYLLLNSAPGDNLRAYFTTQAAATDGSENLAGIADPVIDALVERIIAAQTRQDLNIACRALDRVFRAGRYWISHWYGPGHRIAYWDVFGRPATKPRYSRGAPETWWYDRDKAAKIERAG